MSEKNWFDLGSYQQRQPATEGRSSSDFLTDLVPVIAQNLQQVLPTEQDNWWFLAEQFDKERAQDGSPDSMLKMFPLKMFPIEYEGRRSEESYVGTPNPGVVYLNNVQQVLGKKFGDDIAQLTVAAAFTLYTVQMQVQLNAVRLKYAVHFHNNCIKSKSFRFADEWNEVIMSLGGD